MARGETAEIRPIAHMSTVMEDDARKFEYFCDAICGVYCGIQPEQSTERIFNADFSAHAFDTAVLASIDAPGHQARRDRSMIRTKPDDHLFLNFSAFSGFLADHAGRAWHVQAATPFLLDNEQPFHLDFDKRRRMRLYSLRFSKEARTFTPDRLRQVNQAIASTATGRQLSLQMRLMCQSAEAGNPIVASLMSQATLGLLSLLIDEEDGQGGRTGGIAEIKSVARSHIEDADFGIDNLATIFRCSARTLQSRFAEDGQSFSAWLLAERLDLARDRLVSPVFVRRSIEAIAWSCGFRDASHFHRAFKQRFSMPPGQMRQ